MATLENKIAQLKAEYPTLTYGINDETFQMSEQQYEETITSWATLAIQLESEAQAKAASRQAILDRLGLTEEEARLLLG